MYLIMESNIEEPVTCNSEKRIHDRKNGNSKFTGNISSLAMEDTRELGKLFLAIANGEVRQIDKLLGQLDDINIRDGENKTPLMYAVCCTNDEVRTHVVRILLRHGADVNAQDENGQTALMFACMECERVDIVRLISRNKRCDFNIQDNEGFTALMHAINSSNLLALRLLVDLSLKQDVDLKLRNVHSLNALELAVKLQMPDFCKCLINEGNAKIGSVRDQKGLRLLLDKDGKPNPSSSGSSSRLSYLPDQPPPPPPLPLDSEMLLTSHKMIHDRKNGNSKFTGNISSLAMEDTRELGKLFLAIANGEVRQIDKLLGQLDDINIRDGENKTPLMYAVCCTIDEVRTHVVRILLRHGADVNAQDENGQTALMFACMECERVDIVRLISRNKRCDFNIQDNEGFTALMHAINSSNLLALRLLVDLSLKQDVDLKLRNVHSLNALELAVKLQMPDFCKCLINEGNAKIGSVRDQKGLRLLLDKDGKPNPSSSGSSSRLSMDIPSLQIHRPGTLISNSFRRESTFDRDINRLLDDGENGRKPNASRP
ncbi:uncharacterized protein LOC111132557 isoform X2 [Crassostrea virginica]